MPVCHVRSHSNNSYQPSARANRQMRIYATTTATPVNATMTSNTKNKKNTINMRAIHPSVVINITSVAPTPTATKTASEKAPTRARTDRKQKELQNPFAAGEPKKTTIKTAKDAAKTAAAKDKGKKAAPRTKTAKATSASANKRVGMMKETAFDTLVSIAASAARLASSASAAAVTVATAAERERAVNTNSTRPSKPSSTTTARATATTASKPTSTTVVGFGRGTTTTTTARRPPVQKPVTAHTNKVASSSRVPKDSRPAENTQAKKLKTPSPSVAASRNDAKEEFKHTTTTDRKVPPVAATIIHTNNPVEPRVAEPKDTRTVRKDTQAKTDTVKEHKEDILSANRVRSRDEDWVVLALKRRDIFESKSGSPDTGDRRKVRIDATPARRTRREQQPTSMRGRKLKTADLDDEDAHRTGCQAKVSADFKEEKTTQEGAAGSTGMAVLVESAVPGEETPCRFNRPLALPGLDRAALSSARAFAHTPESPATSAFRPISDPESHPYAFQSHGPESSDRAMSHKSASADSNGLPVRPTSVYPHLGAPVRPADQKSTLAPSAHTRDATTTGDFAPKAPSHAASASSTLLFRNAAPIGVPQESVSAAAAPTPAAVTSTAHKHRDVADNRPYSIAGVHERFENSEEAPRAFVPIPSRPARDPNLHEALDLSSTSSSEAGSYGGSVSSEVPRPHVLDAPVRPADQESTLAPSAHAHDATTTGDFAPKSSPHAASASRTLSFRNSAPIGVPQESVSAATAPTPARVNITTQSHRHYGVADRCPYSIAGLLERSENSEEAPSVPILSRPARDPALRKALELLSTSSSDAGSNKESGVSEVARPQVPFLRRPQRGPLHEALDLSSSGGSSVTPNDLSHKVAGYRIGGSTTVSSSSALPQAPQPQGPSITPRHPPVTCGNTTDLSPAPSSEAPPAVSATYSALSSNAPEPMDTVKEPTSASSATTAARLATRNTYSSVGFDATADGVAPPLSAHSAFRRHIPSVPNPIVTTSPHNNTSTMVGCASERTDVAEGSLRPSSAAAARLVTRVHNHDELSDSADSRVGGDGRWDKAKAIVAKYELKYGRSWSHGDSLHESSGSDSSDASTISSSGLSCEGALASDVHDVSHEGDDERTLGSRYRIQNPSHDYWVGDAIDRADIFGRRLAKSSPHSNSQHDGANGEMGRERKGALALDVHDVFNDGDEDPSDEWAADTIDGADIFGRRLQEGSPRSDSEHDESGGEMERGRNGKAKKTLKNATEASLQESQGKPQRTDTAPRKQAARSSVRASRQTAKDKEQQKESQITCGPVCRCTRSCCKSHREKPRMSVTRSAAEAQTSAAKATPSPPPQRPSPPPAVLNPPAVSASRVVQTAVPAMTTVAFKLLSIQQARNSPTPRPPPPSPMSFHTTSRPASTRALPSYGSQVDPWLDAMSPRSLCSVTSASVSSGREVCTRPRAPGFRELTWRRGRF